MSAVLDDTARRRAKVRAVAAAIIDVPKASARFHIPAGGAVRPSSRKRIHGSGTAWLEPRFSFGVRRGLAVAVLLAQFAVLMVALFAPPFRVSVVAIDGSRLLSRDAILSAAGLSNQSIFTIDGTAVRQRLLALPWIRTATVTTQLPASVHITITEWSPTLRLVRPGQNTLLADNGATVDASAARPEALNSIPLLVDLRPAATGSDPSAALVQFLDASVAAYPATFGVKVAAFEWQADGLLSIWSASGWRAILGHMDTSDEVAGLPSKLADLAALKGSLDFVHPKFGYVDLENPAAPAVGGQPGIAAEVQAALALAPPSTASTAAVPPSASVAAGGKPVVVAPAATATPTPAPTPKPAPTPTPFTFYVAPPATP